MKIPFSVLSGRLSYSFSRFLLLGLVVLLCSCGGGEQKRQTYVNPVIMEHDNTSFYFFRGVYYYTYNSTGRIFLRAAADPTAIMEGEERLLCNIVTDYGLRHPWHPQLVSIDGVWYLYFSGDDGNTDNQQIYVLENRNPDPMQGSFTSLGRIPTDAESNRAMHPYVFRYDGVLYMLWSGWETRRVTAETQCIYIARMSDPRTISGPRVKLSEPQAEWERQWVNSDGAKLGYPVYVNEAPFLFPDAADGHLYIFFSASAHWTTYYCIAQLSAPRDCDLTDPASWEKAPSPVFTQSQANGVYGPGQPFIVPSPDGSEHFLIYTARSVRDEPFAKENRRTVRMQKINFTAAGTPMPGEPQPDGKPLAKPSGIKTTHRK